MGEFLNAVGTVVFWELAIVVGTMATVAVVAGSAVLCVAAARAFDWLMEH